MTQEKIIELFKFRNMILEYFNPIPFVLEMH